METYDNFYKQLKKTRKKCHKCKYSFGFGIACSRVGGCYKPIRVRLRHFWWRVSNPFRKIKLSDP